MKLRQKLRTAIRVLKEEGIGGFLHALKRNIKRKQKRTPVLDEAKIAFDALEAETQKGLMIDVGAHFGGSLAPFADAGWRVLAFEPDSANREKLVESSGELENVTIDSRAVSDRIQQNVILYRSDESTGISGLSSFRSSHRPCEDVEVTTLEHVLKETGMTNQEITFLKIDTEGFDLNVLKGVPWQNNLPKLVLCEFEDSKTIPLGHTFHDLADYLVGRGYKLIVSEWYPIERYGRGHKWRRFAVYPCELQDSQGWGNILATREDSIFDRLLQICQLAH